MQPGKLAVTVAVLFASLVAGSSRADQYPPPLPNLASARAVVMELETGELLYGREINSRALQGSIAKILTGHVALWAVSQGFVSLGDVVPISERAQAQGCTCASLNGGAGTSQIVQGERWTLEELLHSSLMFSTGEPTDAIAEYVGGAVVFNDITPSGSILESDARMNAFLGLVNDHVAHMNAQNSIFYTIHGGDSCDFSTGCDLKCVDYDDCANTDDEPDCAQGEVCDGGTTPLDLFNIWSHIVRSDARFLDIIGAYEFGPFNVTFPGGTKTYDFSKKYEYYPGIDGEKNGSSPLCQMCWIMQATRLGRTLVANVLQSPDFNSSWSDVAKLFDYGFHKIFGPDRTADGRTDVPIARHGFDCKESGHAVSATLSSEGEIDLTLWAANPVAGAIAPIARSWSPTGPLIKNTLTLGPAVEAALGNLVRELTPAIPPVLVERLPTDELDVVERLPTDAVQIPNPDVVGPIDPTGALPIDLAPKLDSVDVAMLSTQHYATASTAAGVVHVSNWTLHQSPLPGSERILQVSATSDIPGYEVRTAALDDELFAVASRELGGALTVTLWRADAIFGLQRIDSIALGNVDEFDVAAVTRPLFFGERLPQVVVATRLATNGYIRLFDLGITDRTPRLFVRSHSGNQIRNGRNVSVTHLYFDRWAVGVTAGDGPWGEAKTIYMRTAPSSFERIGDFTEASGVYVSSDTAIAPVGGFGDQASIMAMQENGRLSLVVSELPRRQVSASGGWEPRDMIDIGYSGNLAGAASQIEICRVGTSPENGYVTAVRTSTGRLKLIPWTVD